MTYPGFHDFPQRDIVEKQMRDGGSLISFEVKGGAAAGEKLMNYLARKDVPMELAVSLGGAITYVEQPATMTHAVVPEADRLARGHHARPHPDERGARGAGRPDAPPRRGALPALIFAPAYDGASCPGLDASA